MWWRIERFCTMMLPCMVLLTMPLLARAQAPAPGELDALQEKAMKAAIHAVSPSIVKIETVGGTDITQQTRQGTVVLKGLGPTTGVIVGSDGYIISSTFNFADKPTSIFVTIPGHKERYVAKQVATDNSRMVTLLKVEATGLPVPVAAPKADLKVGQLTLAMGRTLDPDVNNLPSVSVGIISALNRIWGKAVQTDAKTSPVNYGGPLVDIQGRVIGILLPLSPNGQGETAGVQWYDGGIGFAISLEDINSIMPRFKNNQDLQSGTLGVNCQGGYDKPAKITSVTPGSSADVAGMRVNDVIIEVDGKPVRNYAQVRHALGGKYEGDLVTIKVLRAKKEMVFSNIKLGSTISKFGQTLLGILPMRDDPKSGVEVRYVYPKSPAELAGFKVGDRITKIGPAQGRLQRVSNRNQLATSLSGMAPGVKLKVEVTREGSKKPIVLTPTLGQVPDPNGVDLLPDVLPEKSSKKEKSLQKDDLQKPVRQADKDPNDPNDPADDVKKDDKKEDKKKDDKKDDKKKSDKKKDDKKKSDDDDDDDDKKDDKKKDDKKKDDDKKKGDDDKKDDKKKDDKKKSDKKKDDKKKSDDDDDDDDDDAEEVKKKVEVGELQRTTSARDRNYWLYVPRNYSSDVAHALVIWLHPTGKNKKANVEEFINLWYAECASRHIILAIPLTDNELGWVPDDGVFIEEVVKAVKADYTIDNSRVIAHGMERGGQLAYYLGFHNRNVIRGVCTISAPFASKPRTRIAKQPLSFFMIAGALDPVAPAIAESKAKLIEFKYPVIHREIPDIGLQYTQKIMADVARWVDSLDWL